MKLLMVTSRLTASGVGSRARNYYLLQTLARQTYCFITALVDE